MGKMIGGGVESVIMNYYRAIDRSKIQFDFICDADSTNIPKKEIESLGGHVIICPPYQHLRTYNKFLYNLFKKNKYQIVHSHINTLSVFPLRIAKKAGVPTRIAHSHSTTSPKEFKRNLLKNTLKHFSKVYATDYFACGEAAGRFQFGDKAFDKGLVKVIPNAIDVDKFKFDETARKKLRQEFGFKDSDFVIGHIGRFVTVKNHAFLIDAFAEVKKQKPEAKLLLVGQGPLEQEIKDKVKSLGLEKDVVFAGQRSDTGKCYSAMDVFVLPSLYEGLPVVGIEAQANGLPCLFSNKITKEILLKKTTVLLPFDIRAWARRTEPRKSPDKIILADKYDIKEQAKLLESFYSEPPKVLHVLNTNCYSGAENIACTIIKSLSKKYNFAYCSPYGPIEETLKTKDIKFFGIEKLNYKNLKKVIDVYHPKIIHAHDFRASIIASAFTKKCTVVAHIHKNDPQMKKISLKSILFLIKSRKFLKIIGVSDVILNEYIYREKIKPKYITIENYVDENAIVKKANAFKVKKQYDLFFFGRLSSEKNPLEFIEIIKDLSNPSIGCIMIGDGPLREECRKKIEEYNLTRNIDMIGFRSNPYPYIKASKIGIMPSKFEGFGLTAIESTILKKPVLNSGTGCLSKIFANTNLIVSNKNDYIAHITKNSKVKLPDISIFTNLQKWQEALTKVYETTR